MELTHFAMKLCVIALKENPVPVSSEMYAVAKFMTSAKFMTLTLSLTLIYDPNPNPNPIPCEILDVEILDACADSPIVINFASGEFRATPV